MKIKFLGAVAAGAIIGFAAQASATELLINGGFENQSFPGTTSYYNVGPSGSGANYPVPAGFGWTVSNGNVDIISYQSYGPAPTNGGNYGLDLVGYGSTGEISQTFNTVTGRIYYVSLDFESNPGVTNPTAAILVNGSQIGSVTGGTSWKSFGTSFVATGSTTTFALNETYGLNNGGVFLDNVSVAVPEISTWVMMLAGFAGLGFAGYGRSRNISVQNAA